MSVTDFPAILGKAGAPLSTADTTDLFDAIFTGRLTEQDIIAYLSATADRKPTVDELVGAVTSMRRHMRSLKAPAGAIDLCGTGGDGANTFNISTTCAFVVAAAAVMAGAGAVAVAFALLLLLRLLLSVFCGCGFCLLD